MTDSSPIVERRHSAYAGSQNGRAGALVLRDNFAALGIVRSLGRRGIPVWVLTDARLNASTSRYARRTLPWPLTSQEEQVDYLLNLAKKHGLEGWMLFPIGDEVAALLAHHYEALGERFRLTTPPWEVLRWAYDKRLTYALAAELGVHYPWTYHPANRDDLACLDHDFPLILKPAIKKTHNRFTYDKAWRVENKEEMLSRYDEASQLVDPQVIMAQELIPGGGETQFSYAALCTQGQVLASVVARRTRQYPIEFGNYSTYVETIEQPGVEEPSRRLLERLGYTGIVELEYKRDPRSGEYKLLDINARVWGWHTLCMRAGVDFPYLLWKLAHDEPLPQVRARTGVHWVRMITDLPAVAQEIRAGHLSPWSYLASLRRPLEFSTFALDDPLPAFVDVPLKAYHQWRRARKSGNGKGPTFGVNQ